MTVFDLSEVAGHLHPRHAAAPADPVLPDRARERAATSCATTIAELTAILRSDDALREVVSDELAEVAKTFGTPRRTVLLESAGAAGERRGAAGGRRRPVPGAAVLDRAAGPHLRRRRRWPATVRARPHDVLVSAVRSTARGEVGVVTTRAG